MSASSSHAKSALHTLLSPDGYYTYLQIPKQPTTTHNSLLPKKENSTNDNSSSSSSEIDKTKIEKNYRKLSLKLHPDRPGGDAETFRLLERAKCVLMSDKLRKEYDLLGLDLEEEEHHQPDGDDDIVASSSGENDDGEDEKKADGGANAGNPDSLLSHMASATVAGVLQLAVRTAMMAFVSLLLTKYKYITIAAILFLLYTSFQINRARSSGSLPIGLFDVVAPMIISTGLVLMYYGRVPPPLSEDGDTNTTHSFWSWTFWCGEALVMAMFAVNSLTGKENSVLKPSPTVLVGFYILSMIICLILRGKTWRYVAVLGFEMGLALLAVIVFPIMEMILEEILNEKLRKVGEKVRQYAKTTEEVYKMKLEEGMRASEISKVGGSNPGQKTVELDVD